MRKLASGDCLPDKAGRAELKSLARCDGNVRTGHHQHRNLRMLCAQLLEERVAVGTRHRQVEQHGVGARAGHDVEYLVAALGDADDLDSFGVQRSLQSFDKQWMIIRDDNTSHGFPPSLARLASPTRLLPAARSWQTQRQAGSPDRGV